MSGKELTLHYGVDRDLESIARRLLSRNEEITSVNVGSYRMTVWIRGHELLNFYAPEGLKIEAVSAFADPDERRKPSVAVELGWSG